MCDTDTANTVNTEARAILKIVRSDSNSSAPVCRVCYEGEDEGKLISPCQCAGSIQFIHIHCLEHSANSIDSLYCDICKDRYPLVLRNKPLLKWCRNTDALLSMFQEVCDSFLKIIYMMILHYLSIFLFNHVFGVNYVVVNISDALKETNIFALWISAIILCVGVIILGMNIMFGYIPFWTEVHVFLTCLMRINKTYHIWCRRNQEMKIIEENLELL